jgi:hypothetical protein
MANTFETFGQAMGRIHTDRATLDPADFEFCCEYYCGPIEGIADAFAHTHWPDDCMINGRELGTCSHCGTAHHYGAIFRSLVDGSYLTIGNVCASKFFHFKSRKAYLVAQAAKVADAAARRAQAAKDAEAVLNQHDGLRNALEINHYIIRDISAKLFKYGSISDRQIELVFKIAEQETTKARDPEYKPIPADLTADRQTFTGAVLAIKSTDSAWGIQTKILLLDDRGFKLWGTYPTTGTSYDVGARISFRATLQRSKDDSCFGFFSRPTAGKLIN